MATLQLTTPADFVNYYTDLIQKNFGMSSIQVNKVGFIGFLLNPYL